MKKRNYFLLAAVAFVAVLNLFLSVNGQSLSSGLKLLGVEAIANAEYNPTAPLDQKYIPHGCVVVIREIVSLTPEGPVYNNVAYPGLKIECISGTDRCTPVECTKLAQ